MPALSADTWHLIEARWDGKNMWQRINGGRWVRVLPISEGSKP